MPGTANARGLKAGIPAVLLIVPVLLASSGDLAAEDPVVLGWLERASLGPERMVLRGKLDTGAENSSLNAQDVVEFRRGGQRWVRFVVTGENGRTVLFEHPVERIAKVKRAGAASQERYVVLLELCVARVLKRVEVNLTDRSKLDFPLLVGRSFLAGAVLVDSSAEFTTAPSCGERGS